MGTNKMIAIVVGGAVLLAVGYLLFNVLLADFYGANAGSATGVWREMPIWWAAAVGSLAYAYLVGNAIPEGASIAKGATAGAIVGFTIWLAIDFTFYGSTNINNLTLTVLDPFVEAAHAGIAGAAMAAVMGAKKGA